MNERLPWQKGPTPGTFVATPSPEGRVFLSQPDRSRGGFQDRWWGWSISFNGEQVAHGNAADRQAAADAATEAWPALLATEAWPALLAAEAWPALLAAEPERQAKLKAVAEREAFVEGMVDRDPVQAEIEAATSEELRTVIWLARQRWAPDGRLPKPDGRLEAVMAACSAELFRRRQAAEEG